MFEWAQCIKPLFRPFFGTVGPSSCPFGGAPGVANLEKSFASEFHGFDNGIGMVYTGTRGRLMSQTLRIVKYCFILVLTRSQTINSLIDRHGVPTLRVVDEAAEQHVLVRAQEVVRPKIVYVEDILQFRI